ncbi:hypothetical protein N7463_001932 [Penicillium fimorum]|uniref:Uncharacterized protein n=1 Tax=Penicillium fimorum TaxID=1882269 RepID=A0A9W9XYW4_9EURO|nr:hypothetical protein N7463_001932 [Penicillium fimorum]
MMRRRSAQGSLKLRYRVKVLQICSRSNNYGVGIFEVDEERWEMDEERWEMDEERWEMDEERGTVRNGRWEMRDEQMRDEMDGKGWLKKPKD